MGISSANNFSTFLSTVNSEDGGAAEEAPPREAAPPAELSDPRELQAKRILAVLAAGTSSEAHLTDAMISSGLSSNAADVHNALSYLKRSGMVEESDTGFALTAFAREALNIFQVA